ncbi:hypothetical protein ROO89_19070 [Acinetobacter baumannii]|nr:hypothetical protein [Acinetobacter baumannii]MDY7323775.1 hypothetical protein [Acinetobacter baumannii]
MIISTFFKRAVPTNNDKICEAGMTQRLELHQVEQLTVNRTGFVGDSVF